MQILSTLVLLGAAEATRASNSKGSVWPLRRSTRGSTVSITSSAYGLFLDGPVTIGDQDFQLVIDTGSSDLWVLKDGWKCINATTLETEPQASCNFANAAYKESSSFQPIKDLYAGASYGAGNILGDIGLEDVTFGGITVKGQTTAFITQTTIPGSGTDSGILGLGYPALTSQHRGKKIAINESQELLLNRITYQPLLRSMADQGSIEPWFSLALDRYTGDKATSPGGFIGLGKIPPVQYSSNWAKTPVEITDTIPALFTNGTKQITEWTLTIEALYWGDAGSSNSQKYSQKTPFQAVVDSGQAANVLPKSIVDDIHSKFNPPVKFNSATEVYEVACDASAPSFGIKVGGQIFYLQTDDLIVRLPDGSCMSSLLPTVGSGNIQLNFLGDPFLHNVVAVFDFGKDEMRFAKRERDVTHTSASAPASTPTGTNHVKGSDAPRSAVAGTAVVSLLIAFTLGLVM